MVGGAVVVVVVVGEAVVVVPVMRMLVVEILAGVAPSGRVPQVCLDFNGMDFNSMANGHMILQYCPS